MEKKVVLKLLRVAQITDAPYGQARSQSLKWRKSVHSTADTNSK